MSGQCDFDAKLATGSAASSTASPGSSCSPSGTVHYSSNGTGKDLCIGCVHSVAGSIAAVVEEASASSRSATSTCAATAKQVIIVAVAS